MVARQGCVSKGGGNHDVKVEWASGSVPSDIRAVGSLIGVILLFVLLCARRGRAIGSLLRYHGKRLLDKRAEAGNLFDDFG